MKRDEKILADARGHTMIRSYHSSLPPQQRPYREHWHTECELSVFLTGSGVYAVGEATYEFRAGDVFLFGSNEQHCITSVHDEFELLNIRFEPRLLWEQRDSAELINLFAARKADFGHRFDDPQGYIQERIRAIEEELQGKAPCRDIMAKYLLFSALAHMIRAYDCVAKERRITPRLQSATSLKKAVVYINAHLDSRLTLKEIADVACMAPSYFSALFKKYNGTSPWEYITIKRVERAIELLQSTDMTKLEIAERCGFSGSSNFYKAFATVTGKRPSDYAKKGSD